MATLSDFQSADQIQVRPVKNLEMAWNIQVKIDDLQQKIARLEAEKEEIIQDHLRIGLRKDGPYSIQEKIRTRRKVDEELLAAERPDLYDRVCTIRRSVSVKDLDEAIGRDNSAKYTVTSETVEYSIDWDYKHGVEQ